MKAFIEFFNISAEQFEQATHLAIYQDKDLFLSKLEDLKPLSVWDSKQQQYIETDLQYSHIPLDSLIYPSDVPQGKFIYGDLVIHPDLGFIMVYTDRYRMSGDIYYPLLKGFQGHSSIELKNPSKITIIGKDLPFNPMLLTANQIIYKGNFYRRDQFVSMYLKDDVLMVDRDTQFFNFKKWSLSEDRPDDPLHVKFWNEVNRILAFLPGAVDLFCESEKINIFSKTASASSNAVYDVPVLGDIETAYNVASKMVESRLANAGYGFTRITDMYEQMLSGQSVYAVFFDPDTNKWFSAVAFNNGDSYRIFDFDKKEFDENFHLQYFGFMATPKLIDHPFNSLNCTGPKE